jgi:hypothetical protein
MNYSLIRWCILSGLVFAGTYCFADSTESKVKISGSASLEMGEIVSGTYININQASPTTIEKGWQERFLYRFITDARPMDRIRLLMDIEGQIGFSFPQKNGQFVESETARNLFVPQQIEGTYTLGDDERPYLQFGMGYFPYKFNPDATVLGEYLFRTGTYPLFLISDFNHCYGKLLGFRLSSTLFGSLKQDLLFTSETLMYPTQDYSLSYVAHYSLAHCLDFGAGISFSHLFTVNGDYTSGKASGIQYKSTNGDTLTYTFKGVKPAVRLAFDPKPLFPSFLSDMLGKKDARFYAEAFVSGWEDHKNMDTTVNPFIGYDHRLDRTVWMVGANIPMFKLLDVLSLEFEHFPNKYDDSYRQVLLANSATPPADVMKSRTPWKWSLYGKRTIVNQFSIIGMVGRDHYRPSFPSIGASEMESDLNTSKDWRWVVSFNVGI